MNIFNRTLRLFLALCIVLGALALAPVQPARAAGILVDSDLDDIADDGVCTLREAIWNANTDFTTGSIDCDPGSGADTITFADNFTITLGSQLPEIYTEISITGNGAANTIIQASDCNPVTLPEGCAPADYRVLLVEGGGSLTLNGVTVRHGHCDGGCNSHPNYGGGILNATSTLTITNSTISDNGGLYSGGIYNSYGTTTITNSAIENNSVSESGGGIVTIGGTLSITGSTISGNQASNGGGIETSIGVVTITNSTISGNQANNGGGMYNGNNNTLSLTNVMITNNEAVGNGGGIHNNISSPTLNNVNFSANSANNGGGMSNSNNSPNLTNVTFSNNTAVNSGGGMYNYNNSSPALTKVNFSGNSASSGGGMQNASGSNPALTNVTFNTNEAAAGGGMFNSSSNPTLINLTFYGNTASDFGGGMYNYLSAPELTNITFSGNEADNNGGGMHNESSNPSISNTILWGNGTEVSNDNSTPTINDSIVAGGCPTDTDCTNVLNANPLLGALANNGGFTQTMALGAGSSAIDAGSNTACPATDQRGVIRPQGGKCDIGAYEKVAPIRSNAKHDGWVLESDEFSGKGGSLNRAGKTFNLGDDAANRQYRAILSFNTSSIPTDADITKVTLKVRRKSVTGGGNPITMFGGFMVDIKKGNFGKAGLQLTDFNTKATKTYGAFKPKLSGGWYAINLTKGKGQINREGNTQIRLRFKTDDNNNFVANFLSIHSGNATSASRPQLIVEYYVP